ncbi:sulfatase-like hydrolase/transferase [Pontiellaceae bacterium B12219]|nr:sulfatase-like hydrolase/transferase [Pontiellaceae bacterium B12219]
MEKNRLNKVWAILRQGLENHPWVTVISALIALKVDMLISGSVILQEDHWRIAEQNANPWFYLIVCGALATSILVPACSVKIKSVNRFGVVGCFLCVFGATILCPVVLHYNYAMTVMSGVLSVRDVFDGYILADFITRPPFSILYLVALLAGYFVSRKISDFRIFFGVFGISLSLLTGTLLFQYGLPVRFEDVGMLCLFLFAGLFQLKFRPGCKLHLIWVMGSISSVLFFLLGIADTSSHLTWGYFSFVVAISFIFTWFLSSSLPSNWMMSLFWGYLCFLFINNGYSSGNNLGILLRDAIWGGRYFAEDLLIVLLFSLLLFRRRKIEFILFSFLLIFYLAVAYVDVGYFKESGQRITAFMLEMGGGTGHAVKMVSEYLTLSFFTKFITLVLVAMSGPILYFIKADSTRFSSRVWMKWIGASLVIIFVGNVFCQPDSFVRSVAGNVLVSSSIFKQFQYERVKQEDLVSGFERLGVPFGTDVPAPVQPTYKNMILVILESMYNRELSLFGGEKETQPLLSKYKERMERYPNIFCNWPSSNHARTTIWNGLYPIRSMLSVVNPNIDRSSLTEILSDAGYCNSVFYSSDRNYTRLNDYMGHRGIDRFDDADTLSAGIKDEQLVSWGVREDVTLVAMKDFLAAQTKKDAPFSLTYIPACPHMPYDSHDKRFDVFHEGFGSFDRNYTGVYRNQLLYVDWILSELVAALDACEVGDETIIVMVNDHGEMINAGVDGLGHGWSTTPGIANIPIMVIHPEEVSAQINSTIGSQVDVLPTLLGYLGLEAPDNMPLQGRSLRNAEVDSRTIYLGSYQDYSVIEGGKFYYFPKENKDRAEVYRIENDGGKTNFPIDEDLTPTEIQDKLEKSKQFFRLQESLIRHYESYDW